MRHLSPVFFVLLLLVSCSDPGIQLMYNLDLKRDLCISEAYDKLDVGDVDGILNLSPPSLGDAGNEVGAAFLVEIGKLMSAHNKKATNASKGYTLIFNSPTHMRGYPYRELGNGIICPGLDREKCRNRNFWMFKKIAPELTAKIIFENTVMKNSELTSCYEFPWLVKKAPR